MNTPAGGSRAEQKRATQARILEHARRIFADVGYDRTTIRAVAAAAGVDPGLVMHYYGSKANLFAQAIDAGSASLPGGTPDEVAEQLLDRLHGSLVEEPVQSLALLRSMLTHPEAARAFRSTARLDKDRIGRSIPDEDAELRAALVNAMLIGIALGRHLLALDHLADADPDRIVEILRPAVRAVVEP
ncbi:TetR/AcrR family transcriptional regulator [Actinomadura verrucosospora]|uniref:TetR family transcriptional regulator n=1 Tax=Actinomadura verrucosospora TaxID=46165 RepID=A0A7D3VVS1_ACTVE|nr:TetR/AcrR family transcriptional regulator [Actinomadura verrucosospora]QKG22254.1 TetR family transcriptional regulator [Actinomadura verrucosospora]